MFRGLLIAGLLASCATPRYTADGEIRDIVADFVATCSEYGTDMSRMAMLSAIEYGDPGAGWEGVCKITLVNGVLANLRIVIRKQKTRTTLRGLIYHELGHCVLGLNHQDTGTIMDPHLQTDDWYMRNWDKMVDELCRRYQ